MLEPFEGLAVRVHAVPIPDHACFSPDDLVEIAVRLGFTADAHDRRRTSAGRQCRRMRAC